jgi:class 3 adenylate cyclase/tetratricopeptide (TPR) repeat protein
MTFDAILAQVLDLLQHQGRVAYRALKVRFDLDDNYLEALKDELIYARRLAVDEDGRVLVWAEAMASVLPPAVPVQVQDRTPLSYTPKHLADKILTTRSALEGERKQVTVLFCDIANSTPLTARLGPEAMHTLFNRFFEFALDEVHRYEGTINQFLGDGFMALFGAPIAYEDHARRAVLAALGMQRRLTEHRADFRLPPGEALAVRMGLNTGLVVVGSIGDNLRMDYTAVGDTTNLAARLQQSAPPEVILVSQTTSRLVQEQAYLEAIPLMQVKGKEAPVVAYKLLGHRPRRSPGARLGERTLSRFAGRERDLAVLHEVLAQVEAGQGQVVGIVAEAGVGKSRFLYEFRQSLREKRLTYLAGSCLSYGQTIPYLPLIDILRHNCGITEADSPETVTTKVRQGLQEVGLDAEAGAPYLLHLLGVQAGTESLAALSPEAIKTRTFDTLRQMSLRGSRQQPLIFEVEDLHWIDKTSEDYLMSLVESLTGAPILLLGTYRPGYRPPWVEKSYTTQVALRPLASRDSLVVVRSVAPRGQLSDHLTQVILAKAEGNPFFLEELTRAMVEQGELQADVAVPDTIQGVLMARIDRLPDAVKRLLQTASVLGRTFSVRLLEAIWEGPGAVEPLLGELQRLEFIYEHTEVDEPIYVFKHVLTQEVAYDSLLHERRRALHARIVEAIETLYADRLPEQVDRLARHAFWGEVWAKAAVYYRQAGAKAFARSALREAVAGFEQGLVAVEHLPESQERREQAIDLRLDMRNALLALGAFGAMFDHLCEAERLAASLDDQRRLGWVSAYLSCHFCVTGDPDRAVETGQRALALAMASEDCALEVMATFFLGVLHLSLGDYRQAVHYHRKNVETLTGEWLHERCGEAGLPSVFSRAFLDWSLAELGAFAEGIVCGEEAVQIAEATVDQPFTLSQAYFYVGLLHLRKGDLPQAIAMLERSLGVCQAGDIPLILSYAASHLGYAYALSGRLTEALLLLEQGVEQCAATKQMYLYPLFVAHLGEAYLLAGRIADADQQARHALERSRDLKQRGHEAYALRLLGEIAAQRQPPDAEAAAAAYRQAITLADELGMRPLTAHCHLGLGTLYARTGRPEQARAELSAAMELYRTMDMTFWLSRAEAALTQVGSC